MVSRWRLCCVAFGVKMFFSEGLLTLQKCQVMLSPRHFPGDFIQANCLVIRLIDWRLTIGGLID